MVLALALAGWTTPVEAQTEADAETTPAPHWTELAEVPHESLVLINAGLALTSNLVGFGLFAASFETDAANCYATGNTNCGIAGTAVGMTLWVAMQAVVTPLLSTVVASWAGAPVDEGWSYAGAAIASLVALVTGGGAAFLTLFPGEADLHTGLAVGVVTVSIVQAAISLLVQELSRPAS